MSNKPHEIQKELFELGLKRQVIEKERISAEKELQSYIVKLTLKQAWIERLWGFFTGVISAILIYYLTK